MLLCTYRKFSFSPNAYPVLIISSIFSFYPVRKFIFIANLMSISFVRKWLKKRSSPENLVLIENMAKKKRSSGKRKSTASKTKVKVG